MLANVNSLGSLSLEDLQKKNTEDITTFNASAVGASYLPMHSDELTVTGLTPSPTDGTAHILNWCNGSTCVTDSKTGEVHTGEIPTQAGKVMMTRSIARVQLTSLGAKFDALQYKDMSFKVSSVFLANVRANAAVMGTENKDAGFYRGAPETLTAVEPDVSKEFKILQFLIDPTAGTAKPVFKKEYEDGIVLVDGEAAKGADTWGFDKYINANSPESIDGIPFTVVDGEYVKGEGGAYQTRLVIGGTLYQGSQSLGTKYFHIPLKLKDTVGNVSSNKFPVVWRTPTFWATRCSALCPVPPLQLPLLSAAF